MPANIYSTTPTEFAAWPSPNYNNPERRAWIAPYAIITQVAAVVCVLGRMLVRFRVRKDTAGVDDIFIIMALVFAVAFTGVACLELTEYGVDRHTWDAHPSMYPRAALITWIDFVLSLCSTCSTKISVLLLYRRILTPQWKTGWNVAAWAAIGVTTAYFVAGILAFCFICDPLWAYWMAFDPEWDVTWHCADGQWLNYFIGIVSVLSDLYAIALPLIIIGQTELQIPWKQKWTTYFFFCLGFSVVGAGIARTYWLVQLGLRPDTSWTGANLLIWCIAEMQLAIVCACAPSIRLLFISAHQHTRSLSRQYRQRNDSEQSPIKPQDEVVAMDTVRSAQTIYISYSPGVEPKDLWTSLETPQK